MKLRIISIADKGDIQNERFGLEAIVDCDLKYHVLFKTLFHEDGSFYNRSKAAYWFAPKTVKGKDKIVVYTRSGESSQLENKDGSITYFFYWGLDEPIFSDVKNGIVIAEINSWDTTKGL